MKKITISINKQCSTWNIPKSRQLIRRALEAIVDQERTLANLKKIKVSVLLADDKELQALKSEYFGVNMVTNVLSFPSYDDLELLKHDPEGFLGDIAISYSKVYNESFEQGKSFESHLTHLVVHSVLHLVGYDHINDEDASKMESLEIRILDKLGIANPYNLVN